MCLDVLENEYFWIGFMFQFLKMSFEGGCLAYQVRCLFLMSRVRVPLPANADTGRELPVDQHYVGSWLLTSASAQPQPVLAGFWRVDQQMGV